MAKDYYRILGISKDASEDDIRKAYREFALRFSLVTEAYEILSDKKRRDFYNLEQGVKGGIGGGGGTGLMPGGQNFTYTFHGDPSATFAQFFGTDNPFEGFFAFGGGTRSPGGISMFVSEPEGGANDDTHQDGDPFGVPMGGRPGTKPFRSQTFAAGAKPDSGGEAHGRQDPAIEHDLHVTLEEVLRGCTKKMKTSRKVMEPDGRMPKREEKVLTIDVKPGWKAGTKITFQREGDQLPGTIPADIVFIIRDKPHPQFKREGADIRYTARITLKQALCGVMIEVPTLTKGKISLPLKDIVKPTTTKRIQGQGLPYPKDPTKRGDLIVGFDIQFPEHLTESARQILWDTLPPHV